MLTKASASTQGLTKTYLYSNYTELTKMTASEYGGTTRDYTYEHDMAGRLTRQVQNVFSPNSTTTYNYEWDAMDRMTKVQRVASGVTKTINYTYNAAGLRVRRVDTSTNVTKLWTYAGNNIASVSTKSGGSFGDTSTQEWVYTVAPAMINNVLERHKANYASATTTSEYYQYDHRGNVAAVTDSSGKILRGYQYDVFGNIPFSFATGQSGGAPTDDILFTGKDLDPDTGLYYFNVRWYDSELGRYATRSPLPTEDEHGYTLGESNPIANIDPTGAAGSQVEMETVVFLSCVRANMHIPRGGCRNYADMICGSPGSLIFQCLRNYGVELKCCSIQQVSKYMFGWDWHSSCELICHMQVWASTGKPGALSPWFGFGREPSGLLFGWGPQRSAMQSHVWWNGFLGTVDYGTPGRVVPF